jgi:molecular chaperone GrpE
MTQANDNTRNDGDGGQDGSDNNAVLDADLEKLQAERDNLFSQLARVQADFKNAQRRLEADKQQSIQYANERLIKALIPVMDNFDRAVEVDAAKTDSATLLKGVQMVREQLTKALAEQQVQLIAPAAGTPFDANLHQAILQQPGEEYAQPTVTQLLQKGYSFHGRVLRPAQVAVNKQS